MTKIDDRKINVEEFKALEAKVTKSIKDVNMQRRLAGKASEHIKKLEEKIEHLN
jgi:hypothetical protein